MRFDIVRRSGPVGWGRLRRRCDYRVTLAALAVGLAVVAEFRTAVPGFRLLLAGAVVLAPAFLFVRFWRVLAWLRDENELDALLQRRHRRDWRGRRRLWLAFEAVWLLDLVATVRFFAVPGVRELHPVTVLLYRVAGPPGVVLAGTAYAVLVVAIVRGLPRPRDVDFLLAAALWYGVLVVHNYVLLLGGRT